MTNEAGGGPAATTAGFEIDPADAQYAALFTLAGRISKLLEVAEKKPDEHLRTTLDLFLGAVYAFILSRKEGYQHRTGPIEPDKVLTRAQDVASGRIRLDGAWMAGFHFNSGRFRVAAVYHRALKIVAGKADDRWNDKVKDLRADLKRRLPTWDDAAAFDIHEEINSFKHVPKHDAAGRTVQFDRAIKASEQIADLLEMWC